jgi:hypothetical protein
MVRIDGELVIERPVEDVFDFVADERNEPLYNPRMVRAEKLTPGPVGAGTQFSTTVVSGRRPLDMVVEYTAAQRPHRLASRSAMASAEVQGALTFDPVPQGTRMRWSWDLQPKGFYRFLTPLMGPVGRRSERRIWAGLKRYLEKSGG